MITLLLSITLFGQVAAPGGWGCRPAEWPVYRYGYADLYSTLGPRIMGYPTSCEMGDDINANGSTFQETSTGFAYWVADTNTVMFTWNQEIRYALTPSGARVWLLDDPRSPSNTPIPADAPLFAPPGF